MSSPGKLFEKEVRKGLTKSFPAHVIYHESDFPVSWIKKSAIRFKRPQAVDYLVLGKKSNFAIEVKYTQSLTFSFGNVRDSQLKFLTDFHEKAGRSFIVIGYSVPINVVLISPPDFLGLVEEIGKKSINFKNDLDEYGHYFVGLPRVKLIKKYYVDFTPLRQLRF